MPSIHGFGRLVGLLAAAATFLALPALAQEAPEAIPGLQDALTGTGEGGLSGTVVQLFVLVTVLSLAPGIAMMVTCLPFMVIDHTRGHIRDRSPQLIEAVFERSGGGSHAL